MLFRSAGALQISHIHMETHKCTHSCPHMYMHTHTECSMFRSASCASQQTWLPHLVIVHHLDLLDGPILFEHLTQVPLPRVQAEAKHPQHLGRVRVVLGEGGYSRDESHTSSGESVISTYLPPSQLLHFSLLHYVQHVSLFKSISLLSRPFYSAPLIPPSSYPTSLLPCLPLTPPP